jgi:hypothetical protein
LLAVIDPFLICEPSISNDFAAIPVPVMANTNAMTATTIAGLGLENCISPTPWVHLRAQRKAEDAIQLARVTSEKRSPWAASDLCHTAATAGQTSVTVAELDTTELDDEPASRRRIG